MSDQSFATPAQSQGGSNGTATPDPASLLRGLEQLRERFHKQLQGLEEILRDRAQQLERGIVEREKTVEKRAGEVEQTRLQLQADSHRWDQERQAMVDQIEHDRKLLADAWERLEREQVKTAARDASRAKTIEPAQVNPAHAPEPMAPGPNPGHVSPVLEGVLWQFQSLRRDVRRNRAQGVAGH